MSTELLRKHADLKRRFQDKLRLRQCREVEKAKPVSAEELLEVDSLW